MVPELSSGSGKDLKVCEWESHICIKSRCTSNGLNIKDNLLRKISPNVEFVL